MVDPVAEAMVEMKELKSAEWRDGSKVEMKVAPKEL